MPNIPLPIGLEPIVSFKLTGFNSLRSFLCVTVLLASDAAGSTDFVGMFFDAAPTPFNARESNCLPLEDCIVICEFSCGQDPFSVVQLH